MKCPNCGFEFFEGCHCPDCGVDVYVFRKTRGASVRLYNDALKLAEERDLSGAAEKLEQSLLFDKNNILKLPFILRTSVVLGWATSD